MTLSNNLQKLQNRAARILTFSSYDTNVEHLFSKLGWRKLSSQREMQKAIMVFKSLNGLTPKYLSAGADPGEGKRVTIPPLSLSLSLSLSSHML